MANLATMRIAIYFKPLLMQDLKEYKGIEHALYLAKIKELHKLEESLMRNDISYYEYEVRTELIYNAVSL